MPEATWLQLFWFMMLGVLLVGYAILDGFDLGVGILHPFAQSDQERRIFMNAIGPLWDGNEVWLVTFGGALFAAFREAYATAFSLFYTPFMMLLFALIFRAVALEFRSKKAWPIWRRFWDLAFCLASLTATFLYGVAVGNSMLGLPIGPDHELDPTVAGQVGHLLKPYALLVGVFAVATFVMHGSIYLYLKTEGDLQQRVRQWIWRTFFFFLAMYLIVSLLTVFSVRGDATKNFRQYPWLNGVVLLNVLAIANIPRMLVKGRPLAAFLSSCCTIAAFTMLFGIALFPNMINSSLDPQYDLTITAAASSEKTLGIMAVVALLGLPFVLSYTVVVYWVFRGKVQVGQLHY